MAAEADIVAVIPLKEPIMHGQAEITELRLHKLRAHMLRGMAVSKDGTMLLGDYLDLAAAMAKLPPSVIGQMGMEDTATVLNKVGSFFPSSLVTG